MKVNKVSSGVYRVWYRGIEGLATVKGRNITISPTLRGSGIGMRSLRDLIAAADIDHERKARKLVA